MIGKIVSSSSQLSFWLVTRCKTWKINPPYKLGGENIRVEHSQGLSFDKALNSYAIVLSMYMCSLHANLQYFLTLLFSFFGLKREKEISCKVV